MRWRRVLRNPSRASILGEYVCCLICNRKWRFSRHDGKVNVELPCIWFCSGAVRDLSAYMTGRLVFFPPVSDPVSSPSFTHSTTSRSSWFPYVRLMFRGGGGFGWHSVYPVFFLIWIGTSNNNGFDWHAFFIFLLKSLRNLCYASASTIKVSLFTNMLMNKIGISSAGVCLSCLYEGLNWSWLQVNQ